jgi:hypothetical protein
VVDVDVISTFWSDTIGRTRVHEIGCDQPKETKELLHIATRHASGKEAVEAAFVLGNTKATAGGSWAPPSKATVKSDRKGANGGKKGQMWRP